MQSLLIVSLSCVALVVAAGRVCTSSARLLLTTRITAVIDGRFSLELHTRIKRSPASVEPTFECRFTRTYLRFYF